MGRPVSNTMGKYLPTLLTHSHYWRSLVPTIRTGIIENEARLSRTSPFGLRRENPANRCPFSPQLTQIKKGNITNLTQRATPTP